MWQCDNLTIGYECYGTKYVSTCSAPSSPRTMSVKVHGGGDGDGMMGCSFRRLKSAARLQTATFYILLASLGQHTAAQHSRRLVTAALHCYCIFVARSSLNDATLSCFSSSATTDCRAKLQSNDNNNDRIAAVVMLPEIRHFNLFPCCFGNLTFCLEFLKCENSNSKILNVSKTW